MNEEEKVFLMHPNGRGVFEPYDDRYDITIHCKNKAEQERTLELIRRANKMMTEELNGATGR